MNTHRAGGMSRAGEINTELLAALKRAVDTIRAFHGINFTGVREEEGVWQLYQQSPEMTEINAAITKAEGAIRWR